MARMRAIFNTRMYFDLIGKVLFAWYRIMQNILMQRHLVDACIVLKLLRISLFNYSELVCYAWDKGNILEICGTKYWINLEKQNAILLYNKSDF